MELGWSVSEKLEKREHCLCDGSRAAALFLSNRADTYSQAVETNPG